MDTLDTKIVTELQRDARQSNRKLAAKLAVSVTTISKRLRRLENAGIVTICCLCDPLALGFQDRMYFCLKTAPGKEAKVAQALEAYSCVQHVALVAGRYDLLVYTLFRDYRSHLRWITNELGSLQEVLGSEEIRILQVVKNNLGYTDSESVAARDTKPKRLDGSDLELIQALERNPRESIGSLAKKAALSRQTIARKLQQLLDDNVIRVVGIADPIAMGFSGYASIFLTLKLPMIAEVAGILAKHERTIYVTIVSGHYNLMVLVSFKSLEDLSHFLLTDVGDLPGVVDRETMIHMGQPRRSFGLASVLVTNPALED